MLSVLSKFQISRNLCTKIENIGFKATYSAVMTTHNSHVCLQKFNTIVCSHGTILAVLGICPFPRLTLAFCSADKTPWQHRALHYSHPHHGNCSCNMQKTTNLKNYPVAYCNPNISMMGCFCWSVKAQACSYVNQVGRLAPYFLDARWMDQKCTWDAPSSTKITAGAPLLCETFLWHLLYIQSIVEFKQIGYTSSCGPSLV